MTKVFKKERELDQNKTKKESLLLPTIPWQAKQNSQAKFSKINDYFNYLAFNILKCQKEI